MHEIGFLPNELEAKLLRLRKRVPGIKSTTECWTAYQEIFLPLLGPERLIPYELVSIDHDMRKICQIELLRATEDGKRKFERKDEWIDLVGLINFGQKL